MKKFSSNVNALQPAWISEARELASACRGMAVKADSIVSHCTPAEKPLRETQLLLDVIGDHLDSVILEADQCSDPIETSLNLIDFARELPKATSQLWSADTTGSASELSRTLPQVSMALMTLSQHVSDAIAERSAVIQCKVGLTGSEAEPVRFP